MNHQVELVILLILVGTIVLMGTCLCLEQVLAHRRAHRAFMAYLAAGPSGEGAVQQSDTQRDEEEPAGIVSFHWLQAKEQNPNEKKAREEVEGQDRTV